ncbi:MAG: hypothetical protein HY913_20580 [Desulfomonile tiedjei]|nr:hypothetical protein [Desulfomonile tiedjei]
MFLPMWGHAQIAARGEALFLGVKKSDRVGKTSAIPDGKPDAVFSLTLNPQPSKARITEIEIQAVSGSAGIWNTRGKSPDIGFVGVAKAKNPAQIVNPKGGELNLNPLEDKGLLLFITEDPALSQTDRRFQVKVSHKDGSAWTVPVKAEAAASPVDAGVKAGAYPVRMSAVLKGVSNYDAVGPGKSITGDDKADGLFVLTVEARDKQITAIEIRNVDGVASAWDTVPNSDKPSVGVALTSDPVRLLNNRDGSVAIQVKDKVDLNLYVADNGSIAAGKTNYRISVKFSDGGLSWCPVEKASATAPSAAEEPKVGTSRVNFLGTWLGFVSTDAVGPYLGLKPDGKADAVFGLDIEVSPPSHITGIEISSVDGTPRKWSTGSEPGSWGLGVAYQNSPSTLLNKSDSSVMIPLDKRLQLYLYAADPGDLATTSQRFRIVVKLADGSSYQQFVQRSPSTTATVAPSGEEPARAKGIITCEFRGFIADLVNTSTRPGKDGYLDGTFIMSIQVDDKKLAKVEIKGNDASVRWSSEPKAPVMFLGVALYPNIYKLVNEKGGAMQVPISGRRTLYLYAADNGLLSDPKSLLTVVVTFTDKTTLSTEVVK